jgi:tRNA pseudouridine55 synthase
MPHNIFAIYKPEGMTSHDVVDQIRRITGEQRVGHAGTLDPLAKGVLVIAIGRDATKQIATIVAKEKEYIAHVTLGIESTTDDEEGEKTHHKIDKVPTKEEIESTLHNFIGEIMQTPPIYSAIKIQGKRAYKSARANENITLEPRKATIHSIDIREYIWPMLILKVTTGPGVYIRALARDIGITLETRAYLSELERTRVGEYTKENSFTFETFKEFWNKEKRPE